MTKPKHHGTPIDIECPTCKAKAGDVCRRISGKHYSAAGNGRSRFHTTRKDVWVETQGVRNFVVAGPGDENNPNTSLWNSVNRIKNADVSLNQEIALKSKGYWFTDAKTGERKYIAYQSRDYRTKYGYMLAARRRQWARMRRG